MTRTAEAVSATEKLLLPPEDVLFIGLCTWYRWVEKDKYNYFGFNDIVGRGLGKGLEGKALLILSQEDFILPYAQTHPQALKTYVKIRHELKTKGTNKPIVTEKKSFHTALLNIYPSQVRPEHWEQLREMAAKLVEQGELKPAGNASVVPNTPESVVDTPVQKFVPTKPDGSILLKENQAWGIKKIRENPYTKQPEEYWDSIRMVCAERSMNSQTDAVIFRELGYEQVRVPEWKRRGNQFAPETMERKKQHAEVGRTVFEKWIVDSGAEIIQDHMFVKSMDSLR